VIPTALLRETVSIEPYGGESSVGPVYEPAVTCPARVERTHRLVRLTADEVQAAEATLYLRGDVSIATGDRVTVGGRRYRVLSVEALDGLLRNEGLRATLGRYER